MLPLCASEGVGVTPWSPLARGRLARPWSDEPPTTRAKTDAYGTSLFVKTADIDKPVVDLVNDIAKARGVPPAQVAMAWVLRQPAIASPIVGATKPHHLEDAVAALSLALSDDELSRLDTIYRPHPPTEAFA